MKLVLSLFTAFLALVGPSFGLVKVANVLVTDSNEHYLLYVRHMTVPIAAQNGAVWDAGNDVRGKTAAEIQAIVTAIKAIEADVVLQEIYAKMKDSVREGYDFTSVIHAKATVLQRMQTIDMMRKFNQDKRYYYWEAKHLPSTTAANWEPGPRAKFYFRQKKSTAFESIGQITARGSKTYGDCWGAICACIWWGASRAMLEPGFNGLYPGEKALDMDSYSKSTIRNTILAVDTVNLVPGDWVYFENYNYMKVLNVKEFYSKKNGWLTGDPSKEVYYAAGENALYLGVRKYGGLGEEFFDLTDVEMRELLRNSYNDDFKKVIKGLEKQGGSYNGLEVKEITDKEAEKKIPIRYVKRLKH